MTDAEVCTRLEALADSNKLTDHEHRAVVIALVALQRKNELKKCLRVCIDELQATINRLFTKVAAL